MALYVCVPCAGGDCANCRRSVIRGRVTRSCSCRHGGTLVARTTPPTAVGGSLVSVHGGEGGVLLDTRNAIILDASTVSSVDNPSDGRSVMAMFLEGRVNRSRDRAAILYLLGPDGAAALISQLAGLAARMGPAFESEFRAALDARMDVADLWPAVPSP